MPQSDEIAIETAPSMAGCGEAITSSKTPPPAEYEATHKILIVDDEMWSALDMEWVVRQLGHEVVGPAATSEAALALAGEHRPDLTLMDISLANRGDGIATAIEIRGRYDIPSIFVSGHADTLTRRRALSARPAGFIEKPFTPEALAQAIETALKGGADA